MNKIIVTGASGRIGLRLSRALKSSYEIIGIDNERAPANHPFSAFYVIDFSKKEEITKGFERIYKEQGAHFISVIHLIAYYSFKEINYAPYQRITVEGTRHLLDVLPRFEIEQFIFTSTLLVYEPSTPGNPITENSPLHPKWAYPRSKVETEKIIMNRTADFPAVILRLAGCYDDECHSIPLSHQIQRIYEKSLKSHFYPGNLEAGATYLHFDDLIALFLKVVEKRGELSHDEFFVVGEEERLSYATLQNEIGELLWGKKWTTIPIPKWVAKIGAWVQAKMPFIREPFIRPWMIDLTNDDYEVDISKSRRLLDWSPKRSLRLSLPKMIENLKKDPEKWCKKNKITMT